MTKPYRRPKRRYTIGMPVRSRLREYLRQRAFDERRDPYTVREVASLTHVNAGVVQDLMSNKSKRIDFKTIDKINAGLKCKMTDWLVDEPEGQS